MSGALSRTSRSRISVRPNWTPSHRPTARRLRRPEPGGRVEAARARPARRPADRLAAAGLRARGAGDRRHRARRAPRGAAPSASGGGTPARGHGPRRPGPDRRHGGGCVGRGPILPRHSLEREIARRSRGHDDRRGRGRLVGTRHVCAGWVRFVPGHGVRERLWGGSTLKEWRGVGSTGRWSAYRAWLAVSRGHTHLEVDASDDSRPILQRSRLRRRHHDHAVRLHTTTTRLSTASPATSSAISAGERPTMWLAASRR